MGPIKNHSPPPPWFEDYMRKSNKIAIRNLQTLEEILERVINLEKRTKSMQNTLKKNEERTNGHIDSFIDVMPSTRKSTKQYETGITQANVNNDRSTHHETKSQIESRSCIMPLLNLSNQGFSQLSHQKPPDISTTVLQSTEKKCQLSGEYFYQHEQNNKQPDTVNDQQSHGHRYHSHAEESQPATMCQNECLSGVTLTSGKQSASSVLEQNAIDAWQTVGSKIISTAQENEMTKALSEPTVSPTDFKKSKFYQLSILKSQDKPPLSSHQDAEKKTITTTLFSYKQHEGRQKEPDKEILSTDTAVYQSFSTAPIVIEQAENDLRLRS